MTGQKMAQCSECRHVFFADMPTDKEVARYYELHYTSTHSQLELQESCRAYLKGHAQEFLHELNSRGLPRKVADFGSSYPVFADEAKKVGIDPLSVDYSEDAATWARERGLAMSTPAEFLAFPRKREFGLIRFSHCLEHLIDPVSFLKATSEILVPGGIAYITQPGFPVCRPIDVDVKYSDSIYPEHLHFFCAISARQLLAKAGFELDRFFCFQNEESVDRQFAQFRDDSYTIERMADVRSTSPSYVPDLGAYPSYLGENMVVYGRLVAA